MARSHRRHDQQHRVCGDVVARFCPSMWHRSFAATAGSRDRSQGLQTPRSTVCTTGPATSSTMTAHHTLPVSPYVTSAAPTPHTVMMTAYAAMARPDRLEGDLLIAVRPSTIVPRPRHRSPDASLVAPFRAEAKVPPSRPAPASSTVLPIRRPQQLLAASAVPGRPFHVLRVTACRESSSGVMRTRPEPTRIDEWTVA